MDKYYVYHLIDPRDNCVFYVGKGTGDRYNHHERDAAKLRFANAEKEARIHKIWDSGMKVKKKKVRTFNSEDAAFLFEKQEIERIGIENLTNISGGGEPSAAKAKKIAEIFIKKLSAAIHLLTDNDKEMAAFLISEMKENLAACDKQLIGS